VADYARVFHNIRRLKFSHNIRPRAGRHDSAEKEEREERNRNKKKKKKKSKKKKKKSGERHASPWASWDRTLLLVCFSACFDVHAPTRARVRRRFHLTRRDQEGSNSVPINLPFTIPARLAMTLTSSPVGASLLGD